MTAMAYPRRFYRKGKGKYVLKFPERMLDYCRWCGTCYVNYPDNEYHIAGLCCRACWDLYTAVGAYRRRGK